MGLTLNVARWVQVEEVVSLKTALLARASSGGPDTKRYTLSAGCKGAARYRGTSLIRNRNPPQGPP